MSAGYFSVDNFISVGLKLVAMKHRHGDNCIIETKEGLFKVLFCATSGSLISLK